MGGLLGLAAFLSEVSAEIGMTTRVNLLAREGRRIAFTRVVGIHEVSCESPAQQDFVALAETTRQSGPSQS